MIRIGVRSDAQGRIRYLSCSGHARFDHEGGTDIVCAGVSALTGALIIGLTQVIGVPVSYERASGVTKIRVPARLPEVESGQVQVLMKTTVRALEELAQHYEGFLRVRWLRPL